MSQLIDITAAKEFMKETLDRVSREELMAIAVDLQLKSKFFKQHLHPAQINQLSHQEMEDLLRSIFVTRRQYKPIMEKNPLEKLKHSLTELLYGQESIDVRFQNFVNSFNDPDTGLKTELAGELLHFSNPDLYWLWSRWMWDPQKKTGAIPLLTEEGFDLHGQTEGQVYLKVGKGVAFVHSIAEPADFQFISRTLFGTDVFLACVYAVYAYTVLRMRMTREFNNVMPGLPELTRRLLGVLRLPQAA